MFEDINLQLVFADTVKKGYRFGNTSCLIQNRADLFASAKNVLCNHYDIDSIEPSDNFWINCQLDKFINSTNAEYWYDAEDNSYIFNPDMLPTL